MKIFPFSLLFIITALMMSSCNNEVFVDDESVNDADISIAAGDSVTLGVKTESLGGAAIYFDTATRIDIYDSRGNLNSSDSTKHIYFYLNEPVNIKRVEFNCGRYRSSLTVNEDNTITFSSAQSLSETAVKATLALFYNYSARTISFTTLPFSGKLKIEKIVYGDFFIEHTGSLRTVSYLFDNSSNEVKEFLVTPFTSEKRRLIFSLDESFESVPFMDDEPVTVEIPSLPVTDGQWGGIGLYGLTADFRIGEQLLPSMLQNRTIKVMVPPSTRRRVDFSFSPIIITNSITVVCINPLNPDVEIYVPGNVLVEDDSFFSSSVNDTPL